MWCRICAGVWCFHTMWSSPWCLSFSVCFGGEKSQRQCTHMRSWCVSLLSGRPDRSISHCRSWCLARTFFTVTWKAGSCRCCHLLKPWNGWQLIWTLAASSILPKHQSGLKKHLRIRPWKPFWQIYDFHSFSNLRPLALCSLSTSGWLPGTHMI